MFWNSDVAISSDWLMLSSYAAVLLVSSKITALAVVVLSITLVWGRPIDDLECAQHCLVVDHQGKFALLC